MEALQHFQAVLVVMSFAPALRRRMTTSFPSKMIDAMQLGLPVVIWGPEYCSAVQWARQGERTVCVTDLNRFSISASLEGLAASPSEQEACLAKSAREAAAGEFNPARIQEQFDGVCNSGVRFQFVWCWSDVLLAIRASPFRAFTCKRTRWNQLSLP